MNYDLPELGGQGGNAFLPDGMRWKRGIEYDTGPVRMHVGRNALTLAPEELYLLGRKLDAQLKLGYDGNHQLNANMPMQNGAGSLSYQGNMGEDGTRHEIGAAMPMFGGRLGVRGTRDQNGNAFSLQFSRPFSSGR